MQGILGRKLGMTQIYVADGTAIPVTVIKAGPCLVVQRKTADTDGYEAVQIGLVEDRPAKNVNQPMTGHFKKAGVTPVRRVVEFPIQGDEDPKPGDEIKATIFEEKEWVEVVGTSKLAKRYVEERKQVLLAAGDTFRAAAVEQLKTWGERNGVGVIAQGSGSDSASVIFDALQAAQARNAHLLIADTAGRLHTQAGLMDELSKIKRVLGKLDASAPHEVLLVIDGTTGQNAINQLRQFHAAAGVTGLVVTKLDGTAKGGVVFALAREFGIPIRFVGLGESMHDLRAFDPHAFVDALLPEALSA